jgi:ATP-binding cassette subfamily B protein
LTLQAGLDYRGGMTKSPLFPLVLRHLRPQAGTIILVMALYVVGKTFQHLSPWFIGKIVNSIFLYQESGNNSEHWENIVRYAVLFVVICLIARATAFRTLSYFYTVRFRTNLVTSLRLDFFDTVMKHSLGFFQDNLSGSLVSKVEETATSIKNLSDSIYNHIYPTFLSICIISIMLYLVMPLLFWVFLIWVCVFVGVSVVLSRRVIVLAHDSAERKASLVGTLTDIFVNMTSVLSFARLRHESDNFKRCADDNAKSWIRRDRYMAFLKIVLELGYVLLSATALWILIVAYKNGQVTAGDFAIVLPLCLSAADSVWLLGEAMPEIFQNIGGIKNGLDTINQPISVHEKPDASKLSVTKGLIEFKDVSFSYVEGKPVFDRLNVSIGAGQRVALVGGSGAGKSTFISLLQRLYDVNAGQIVIDGQDVSDVTFDSLHESIGIVPQDIALFHRSVGENIRYGDLSADDEVVCGAALKACARSFIEKLPQGYDTLVGERGVKLSGGERQRIAIARAILKDAPILILDEGTSSLDVQTEHEIQEAFKVLMAGKTVVAIAHRLSTIRHFDRILVLEQGKIVQDGTHDDLLREEGVYKNLWLKSQRSLTFKDLFYKETA